MKKILLVGLLLVGLFTAVFAETDKIACIDYDKIIRESADTIEAQKILMDEKLKWEDEINEMDKEIEMLYNDYESKQVMMTETAKKEAQEKMQELSMQRQNKVQEYFGENGLFIQKQSELLTPILEKIHSVIDKVAVENNYLMIFDVSAGSVLYAKPNLDITDLVLEELENYTE